MRTRVYLVLLLTGGMVIPLGELPGPVATIAKALPAAPLAEILTASLSGGAVGQLGVGVAHHLGRRRAHRGRVAVPLGVSQTGCGWSASELSSSDGGVVTSLPRYFFFSPRSLSDHLKKIPAMMNHR